MNETTQKRLIRARSTLVWIAGAIAVTGLAGPVGSFLGGGSSSEARADVYWDTKNNCPVAIDGIGRNGNLGPYRGRIPSHWKKVTKREFDKLLRDYQRRVDSDFERLDNYEFRLEVFDKWNDKDGDKWPDKGEYIDSREFEIKPGEKDYKGHLLIAAKGYAGDEYQLRLRLPNKRVLKLPKVKIGSKYYRTRKSVNFSKLYELGGYGYYSFLIYIDNQAEREKVIELEEPYEGGVISMD